MDKNILEFLFVGPLFSINKQLKQIRKEIMGLKEDLQGYSQRIETAVGELSSDFDALKEKLANSPAAEDVSAELEALGSSISKLEGLDQPDVESGSPGEPVVDNTLPGDQSSATTPPEGEGPQVNPLGQQ
jgi:hypothetical protein